MTRSVGLVLAGALAGLMACASPTRPRAMLPPPPRRGGNPAVTQRFRVLQARPRVDWLRLRSSCAIRRRQLTNSRIWPINSR